MISFRDDCRHLAFLYANDRTHFDKPGCLKGHGHGPATGSATNAVGIMIRGQEHESNFMSLDALVHRKRGSYLHL